MRKMLIAGALAVSLAACAQSPGSIEPVSMGNAFQGLSCKEAEDMLVDEQARLKTLEKAQRDAMVGDAVGVFLLLVPVSSLTGGDRSGEIASTKGKIVALEARLANCRA